MTPNCTIVINPIFLALYFTDALELKGFASTFLVAPRPAAPVQVVRVRPMAHLELGKLVAPRAIPREVSGPPLLIQSAKEAVQRWRYEPTYLNEEPLPMQLNVTVTFRLNGDLSTRALARVRHHPP